MTTRLDPARVAPPVAPAAKSRGMAPAAVVPAVAPASANALTAPLADTFESNGAAPGVLPLSQRMFAKPMAKFGAHETVTRSVHVASDIDLTSLRLDVNLVHPSPGDLVVKLTSPSGKTVVVSDRAGANTADLFQSFDLSQAFAGERPKGDWTITVENHGDATGGMLDTWAVAVTGTTRPRPTPANAPVAIAELAERYGWKTGEWQLGLLQAADSKAGGDGKTSAAEVDAYLANPDDLKFLTSSAMQVQRRAVAAAGGSQEVSAFDPGWQQQLARRADANADGRLGAHELDAYLTTVKAGSASAESLWMPDQKAAPFTSQLADHTGEGNLLSTANPAADSALITKDYMRIAADGSHRAPNWVSYELTAADVLERPAGVVRPSDFKTDHALGSLGSQDRDYNNSSFDRGHMKPARDSVNQESMDESMLLSNIAPQTAELNQRSWEMLEQATWELTQATGGKSTIFTGGLFLDEQGQPLPEDQKQWIGEDGQKSVAVPTHFFKAVLVKLPDGTQKTFAYVVPNRTDLPQLTQEDQAAFLRQSRVSVDRVEELLGEDLFAALEDGTETRLEADAMPTFDVADRERFKAASMLWPAEPATAK